MGKAGPVPAESRRLRLAHVIPALSKGGAERVAVDLANWAVAQGHDVTIIAAFPVDPELLPSKLDERVTVRYTGRALDSLLRRYARLVPWLIANRGWLAGLDVLHCHLTFGAILGSGARFLRRLTRQRRPTVIETYHAVGMPIPRLQRIFHAFLLARRDGVAMMAESPEWRRFLLRRPALPSAIIPNGLVLAKDKITPGRKRAFREQAGIPPSAKWIVGTVGRMVPARKPWLFVEAFAETCRACGPDVHFLFAGDGPERRRLEALAEEKGLKDRIHFSGLALDPAEPFAVIDLYFTLCVGPIAGLAALEAAGAGLPVIGQQLRSDYVATSNEWIWSTCDTRWLGARAAELLADEGARHRLAEQQTGHVHSVFTVEAMAESYDALYKSARRSAARRDEPDLVTS